MCLDDTGRPNNLQILMGRLAEGSLAARLAMEVSGKPVNEWPGALTGYIDTLLSEPREEGQHENTQD